MQVQPIDRAAETYGLTKCECGILTHLSLGCTSVRISKMLFISESTTRSHIKNIYRKIGVGSREELQLPINGLE